MIGKYWSRTESGQIYLKLRLKTGRSDNSSNKLSLSAIENKSQYIICSLNRFWRNPITTGDTGENYVGFQIIKKKEKYIHVTGTSNIIPAVPVNLRNGLLECGKWESVTSSECAD